MIAEKGAGSLDTIDQPDEKSGSKSYAWKTYASLILTAPSPTRKKPFLAKIQANRPHAEPSISTAHQNLHRKPIQRVVFTHTPVRDSYIKPLTDSHALCPFGLKILRLFHSSAELTETRRFVLFPLSDPHQPQSTNLRIQNPSQNPKSISLHHFRFCPTHPA